MAKIKITKSKQLKNKKLKHKDGIDMNNLKSKFATINTDPEVEDAMRAQGFWGNPGNVQYDDSFTTQRGQKLGSLTEDPTNENYGLFRGLGQDQYNNAYKPWVQDTYGPQGDVKNQDQLLDNYDPNSESWQAYSPEQQIGRYNQLGELKHKGYDVSDPNNIMKLVTDGDIGSATSLMNYSPYQQMTVGDTGIDDPEMDFPEYPDTGSDNPEDVEYPQENKKHNNLLKYAGVASNLAGLIKDKAITANPSTYTVGNTRAYLGDVNRGAIKGQVNNMMGNVGNSGGSGGSNRQNTLAAGLQGMNALNTAQQQMDVSNRQQLAQNDARNVGSQNAMAAGNTGILNQFELENKQLQNDVQSSNRDNLRKTITSVGAGLADIGEQNSRKNILNNTFDYSTEGNYQNGVNSNNTVNSNNKLQSIFGGNKNTNSIPTDKGNYATEDLIVNDSPDLAMGNIFSNKDDRQQNREYRKSLRNVNDATFGDEAYNELTSDYDSNAPIDATVPQRPDMQYFSKRDVRKGKTTPSLLRNGGCIKRSRFLK